MAKKSILIVFSVLLFIASFISASPVSINGQLHVSGLQLTNECGVPVQLRGVSTHGLQWYGSRYTDASLDFIAYSMNADSVRLAMYVDQNGYKTNPTYYTNMVDTLVDKIGARGMYAIIDWHILYVSGQASGDPNANSINAQTFWTHEAAQHAGKKYVIYEICNEPSPGSVTWADIKTYADNLIPKIRAIDPKAVIICGTPNWSQLGWDIVNNPLSYTNIMYTFHFYAGSHSTGLLTPYLTQLPIFCTEWGASDSSGNGNDNYTNAQAFLDIMSGRDTADNPTGVKISWNEWTFSDSGESTAELVSGMLTNNGPYDLGSSLTTAGQFVYTNINDPAKSYYCGTLTPTITGTPPTPTITPTITITPTQLPWDMIYDGDTAGYTLADGVAASNSWTNTSCTPVGTITETTGGNAGNGMKLSYVTAGYWEGHSWTKSKTVGTNNNIEFDVKTLSGSVSGLLFTLDRSSKRYTVSATSTWKTVRIPLSSLYTTVPSTIGEFDFVNNSVSDYSVIVDNIRLVSVPTNTATPTRTVTQTWSVTQTSSVTPTITLTSTISQTYTITMTHTITPTVTVTATITLTPAVAAKYIKITDLECYPNPSAGGKITFRYTVSGYADNLSIDIYTFGERKFAHIDVTDKTKRESGIHDVEWVPNIKMANGLYYFTIEGTNGKRVPSRHVAAFEVIKQ
jgi:hypothetical protein